MKRYVGLAGFLAVLAMPFLPALASDGELVMLAPLVGTNGHPGEECDTWDIKWRNSSENGSPPYGSCRPPVIKVYAQLMGASADGITGVEFAALMGPDRLADPGYVMLEIPTTSATLTLGRAWTPPDPEPRGMNLTWADCQTGEGGLVFIEQVFILPTQPCGPSQNPPKIKFSAGQHSNPSNQFFRCPLFTLCDAPAFTKVCLGTNITTCQTQVPPFPNASKCSTSGEFHINGQGGPGHCTPVKLGGGNATPAATVNWGEFKGLYR